MEKRYEEKRTKYVIDRIRDNGETDHCYYGQMFPSKAAANKYIKGRLGRYTGTLVVRPLALKAGYVYTTTITI